MVDITVSEKLLGELREAFQDFPGVKDWSDKDFLSFVLFYGLDVRRNSMEVQK